MTVRYPEYKIVCFDKLDEVSSLANVRCLEAFPNFLFVQGDLADHAAVSRVFEDHNIDCVMHFAANSHVQNSFKHPQAFTQNNVIGTQQLLDVVREHGGVRRFIHVSTDEVYGDADDEFVDETQQFMPTNPYSASKAAAEMYVWAYSKSFKIPIVVVRSNNVYGPCQYPESESYSPLLAKCNMKYGFLIMVPQKLSLASSSSSLSMSHSQSRALASTSAAICTEAMQLTASIQSSTKGFSARLTTSTQPMA